MKQCIQLTFPFEKFKNWQKSTYYSSEKFWFLARTWISFWIHLSYPEFDGDHENVNYFDQNSTLEEEISNFLFFRPQNRLQLSNYWPNVKKNPIFGIPMKQCIQLTFPFEKFKNWQKSTYYSSEKFWFLARTWISFWIHLSYPEFDGDHENVNYFDQNSTLEEEISNFLFFRPQNRLKLSNYWPNVITEVSRRYLYLTLFLMGLSPGPDYRRYLHWISKTAIFVISAPLLEHSWCFLWDYRRYLYLWPPDFRDLYRTVHTVHVSI